MQVNWARAKPKRLRYTDGSTAAQDESRIGLRISSRNRGIFNRQKSCPLNARPFIWKHAQSEREDGYRIPQSTCRFSSLVYDCHP